MKAKRERDDSGKERWDKIVELLEQGISPDGLPINPPGRSAGMMANRDGRGGLIWKERFWIEREGHYSYHYLDQRTKQRMKGWYTIRNAGVVERQTP